MRKIFAYSLLSLAAAAALLGCGDSDGSAFVFDVTIENISNENTLRASDGSIVPIVFSIAVLPVHNQPAPMYNIGSPVRDNGFEAFAEDGDSTALVDALQFTDGVRLTGLGTTSVTGTQGLLAPGETYRVVISADRRDVALSLALSFLQGNDVFVGTSENGIALFDAAGNPASGDVTGSLTLLDAGTEVNQEPGLGPDQAARQMEPNTGAAEGGVVRPVDDGFNYPAVSSMLRVTITPGGEFD